MNAQTPPRPAHSAQALVLALDVGTSSTRCCAFDLQGLPIPGLEVTQQHQPLVTADGGSELPADALVEEVVTCLGGVADAATAHGLPILGVGISTFWHAFLGVDAHGSPVTPIYLWNDIRAADAARMLKSRLNEAAVHRRTGCVLHPSYLPARLSWLATAEPQRFNRCAKFLSFGGYLELRLFGSPRCGLSMASGTGLLNQDTLDWDQEVLAALSLAPERLAPLEPRHTARRGISGALSRRLPALGNVPFFPALGDGACSNVGSGAIQPGEIALSVGTSAAIRLFFQQSAPVAPRGLWRYLLDDRRALIGGALSNGGNVFAWLGRTLQLPPPPVLETELERMPPAGHGLTLLPFLAGERNPDYPLDAVGVVVGLRNATTPVQIVQAGLEAVAYRLAAIVDRLRPVGPGLTRFVASGGALQSRAWLRILTDVLGLPVVLSKVREASSRGAALMALEALGEMDSATDLPPLAGETLLPDPEHHRRHHAARQAHEQLYAQYVPGADI